ncbi:hypothetical protein [Amycolatopsis sp. NPDC051061]|uniref:hypothetical protein n=1 Tax=Amycolatopsis sp. NPDC051061 TaxID=3155042 RepID=UPI003433FBEE
MSSSPFPPKSTFGDVFKALRLLDKVAVIVAKLVVKPAEVTWWLAGNHADALGWIRADGLGVDTSVVVPIARRRAMQWFFDWRAQLPVSDLTAFDFADELLNAGSSSANTITSLAKLATLHPGLVLPAGEQQSRRALHIKLAPAPQETTRELSACGRAAGYSREQQEIRTAWPITG